MNEKLDDSGAVILLLRFELVDLIIAAPPLRLGREAFDALDQHATVPAPVKHRDITGLGQPVPEAPEKVAFLFGGAWRRDRPDLERAWIPLRGHALDYPALARGIPAFERNDAAFLVNDMRHLKPRKPLLQLLERLFIIAFELLALFELLEVDRHNVVTLRGTALGQEGEMKVNPFAARPL